MQALRPLKSIAIKIKTKKNNKMEKKFKILVKNKLNNKNKIIFQNSSNSHKRKKIRIVKERICGKTWPKYF